MSMVYTLAEIAGRLGGQVLGDAQVIIRQISTLERAKPDQISFLTNSKYRAKLATTEAGAVILGDADAQATDLPRIISQNPYAYFAKVSALLNPEADVTPGVHPSVAVGAGAQIDPSACIAANAVIGEGAVIGAGTVIGEGCFVGANTTVGCGVRLYPRVVIYHDCVIGDQLIAHSGVVIGSDGFGFAMEEGRWIKIPQIGRVIIGNDVEIGANTTIDRGALDDTVIEEGVKLDNQIQIAHNVRIGAHTVIAGCVGIAGSATIGRRCQIGGSAGILGHLTIADDVAIASFTLIGKSIAESGSYAGIFPFARTEDWRRNAVHLRHLDAMSKRIKKVEQDMSLLKQESLKGIS
jgi:UDP-3-O-[3-hydroxymyristoyl] glucosamine N-acyltransferase